MTSCRLRRTWRPLLLAGIAWLARTSPARGQVLAPNLIYTSLQPCRLVDTRQGGAGGPLAAGTPRTFNVAGVSAAGSLASQGGSATGCPVPGFVVGIPQVQAVVLNFVAVAPAGAGDLQAWPSDQSPPNASVLNYQNIAGLNIANAVIVPVRQDVQGNDITVKAQVSGTHVVVDIQGYFSNSSPVQGSGLQNLSVGYKAGNPAVATASENTAFGYVSLQAETTGVANTAVGALSLAANTTGASNVAVGFSALSANTSGANNVAVGRQALNNNTIGSSGTALGDSALGNNTNGGDNTAVGAAALGANGGGSANTGLGSHALAANVAGNDNTAVGQSALAAATGIGNTAIGAGALSSGTSGSSNVVIGFNAGTNITAGSGNIYIAAGTSGDESSTIRIGAVQSAAFIAGISGETSSGGIGVLVDAFGKLGTTTSSARFKEDIADMGELSTELMKLRPVTFRYKPAFDDGSRLLQYGLVAEEVAGVDPGLVQYGNDGQPLAVRYHFINAMLLNEVQSQQREIDRQRAEISALAARTAGLAALENRVRALEAALAALTVK